MFVLNLALSLKQIGCNVEVVAGDGDYLFHELDKNGIRYYHLESLKRDLNIFNALYFSYELYKLLKKKKYDIVHLNSSNTLIGAVSAMILKRGPKSVFTFHGLSFIDKNFGSNVVIKWIGKFYFKVILKAVDGIVCECTENYNEVIKNKIVDHSEIIYNGLDGSVLTFQPKEEARDYFSSKCGIDLSDNFVIGSTGRLAYQKNYEFLINCFSSVKEKIPNAKLVVIGDGPDRDKYIKQIKKLNLQDDIFLVGEIKNSFRYMKGFDVFTLTSRYEGVSISLIEAIYAPVPILASNVGGNPDVVGDCEMQLFELNDMEDYVNKIVEIQKNTSMLIEHNDKMKSRFALASMANNYNKLYESLAKRK